MFQCFAAQTLAVLKAGNGSVPRQTVAGVLVPLSRSMPTRADDLRSRCVWPCFVGTSTTHNRGETVQTQPLRSRRHLSIACQLERSFDEAELREPIPEVRE